MDPLPPQADSPCEHEIDHPKAPQLAALMGRTVPRISDVFTGGGGGFLDVIASTSDAASGLRATEQAIAELRLTKDALIDYWPDVSLDRLYLVEHARAEERRTSSLA